MRSRSPSRRTTPPPPRISRRSPGSFRQRGKSPERRRRLPPSGGPKYPPGSRSGSPPRSRERREFGHSPRRGGFIHEQVLRPSQPPDFHLPRRSRSPLQREPKARSFSPDKRKMSPKRERERVRPERERMRSRESDRDRERGPGPRPTLPTLPPPRKRSRSKSPVPTPLPSYSGPPEVSPAKSYQPAPYPQPGPSSDGEHSNRNVGSLSERFHGTNTPTAFKKESEQPVFRGPEGTGFDPSDLKKITMVIRRLPGNIDTLERNIINPEDVVIVRRYDEGKRPIFAREEIVQATRASSVAPGPVEEHRRVVAIVDEPPPMQPQGSSRFDSPGRYSDARPRSREEYYPSSERDVPPRDYPRSSRDYDRGHRPPPGFEPRERSHEDRFDRRSEDLRHELDLRRRDERYSSQEPRRYDRGMDYGGGDSDRDSGDLRIRINERRTDRHDDRESSHPRMMMDRPDSPMERERDRDRHRGMMQPSPPGSERRRGSGRMGEGKMHGSGEGRVMHHGGPGGRRHDGPERFHHEPPNFPNQRSERFHYKSWDPNPEHVPKGRSYFEHDNREDEFIRGRGRGMMLHRGIIRGRGTMRIRPYRGVGPMRGGFMRRGAGRRGGYIPRGFFHLY